MKKFLSLLTVFMLAFALAVPVGASDNDLWLYGSHEYPAPPEYDTSVYPYSAISVYYDDVYFHVNSKAGVVLSDNRLHYTDSVYISYLLSGGSWVQSSIKQTASDYSSDLKDNNYVWSNYDIKKSDGSIYLAGIPAKDPNGICDGSSCPATDVNFDDICDDCGMMLAYNLRVTPNEYSIVVKHTDGTTLRFSFTETVAGTAFDALYRDNRITVSFDNAVNHNQYKLIDGEWTDYASYPNIYDYHSINFPEGATILSSDLTVYDENGDPFFQNPLWMEMEKVTQGEMTGLARETAGTMKVLVVCGVGLMALLMVLSLFGKRWLLFLR